VKVRLAQTEDGQQHRTRLGLPPRRRSMDRDDLGMSADVHEGGKVGDEGLGFPGVRERWGEKGSWIGKRSVVVRWNESDGWWY